MLEQAEHDRNVTGVIFVLASWCAHQEPRWQPRPVPRPDETPT
jgi:hypothetical protein